VSVTVIIVEECFSDSKSKSQYFHFQFKILRENFKTEIAHWQNEQILPEFWSTFMAFCLQL